MNEINNLILQAVDTVVNARLAKQSKDTTIIAQIVDNNDAVFGTYTVKYQNANFDVTCNDTSKIYKKEENVYVLLPNGDINSPQKFILGSAKGVKQGDTPIVEITDPNQRYDLVGPPVFNLIKNFDVGIEAGIPGYKDFSRDIPFIYQEPKNEVKLIEYSKQYEYLQFSADFKYAPANDIKKCGNYGIEIGFFTNGDSVEDANKDKLPDQKNIIAYRFDTDSMYGDPFSAYNYTNRAVTIYCEKGTIYDLAYVTLFSEKFDRDGEIEKDDIFVKNINIQFAKLRNEADDYSANILTPYGVFINKSLYKSNGKNAVQLIPKMKYKNQGLNDVEFYWFEKNPTIDTTSDKYNSLGRRGWEDITSQANENILTYEATTDWYNKTIKLVAKYTGHIIREDEVVVYQSQEQFRIVEADNPPNGMIQLNVEKENDGNYTPAGDDYTFAWEYIEVNQYVGKLNVTTSFIQLNLNELKNHNNRTYRCYISKNNSLIGIVEYLVSLNIEVQEDLQVIFEFGKDDNNNGVFLYNENGYIEIEEFTQPRQLNFSVWLGKERLGNENNNVYSYRWELPGLPNSTTELTADYKPEDSMLIFLSGDLESEGPRKDSQKPLNYKIKSSFNRNYINNTVVLEVTYNGTTKRFPYTFSFTKQGDPGTNGTDYQMRIVPMEQGKMLQYYDSNSPKEMKSPSQLNYKLEFYYNGKPDDINNYDIDIKLPPQCENVVGKQNKKYVGIFNNFGLSGKIVTGSADGHNLEVTGQFPSTVTKTVTGTDNKTSTYSFDPPFGIKNYTKNILMITAAPKDPKEKQFKLTGILPVGISEENDNHLFKYDTTIIFNGEGYSPSYCDKALDDYFKISNTDSHYEELDRLKQSFPIGSTRRYNRFSMLEDSSLYMVKRGDENKFYLKVANQFNANEAINTLQMDDIFSFQVEHKEGRWQTYQHFVTSYFPLISTINQYSLMYINEWDGNSVEIKEDKGYIYAPQIGAGHKDTDKDGNNTFTGVIMGEYVIDHEEQGVGLWGFQDGVSTFGFRDNGSAYIGYPTGARLEFDGNNGFIQNAGFIENKSGMQLDFVNGSIWTPSFYLDTATDGKNNKFVFTLGEDNNSEFLIKTADNKHIFEASKVNYVLQSANWNGSDSSTTEGLKIDLAKGCLDSKYVYIDGEKGKFNLNIDANNTTSQFTISAQPVINNIGQTDERGEPIYKTIFKANDKTYWLKSLNYTGNDSDEGTETGLKINLNKGTIDSKYVYIGGEKGKFTLNIPADSAGSQFTINAQPTGTDGKGKTDKNGPVYKTIFKATQNQYYLKSLNYTRNDSDGSTETGLKIDLDQGTIDSKYVYIDGEKGKFNLNINADNTTSQFTIAAQPIENKIGKTDAYGQPIYQTIFKANDNAYWLKSLNYTGTETPTEETNITGLYINLNDGYIKSPKFGIDSEGNAYFKGNINVGDNFIVDGATGAVTIKSGSISFGEGGVPVPDVSGQITTSLKGYATEEYVQGQTSTFVTQGDIDNAIKNIQFPTVSTPEYIKDTYIDMSFIETPAIVSNDIYSGAYYALKTLTEKDLNDLTNNHSLTENIDLEIAKSLTSGRYGYLTGLSTTEKGKVIETDGVAIGCGKFNPKGQFAYDSYVITTESGVRLQRGDSRVYLTDNDFCYQNGSGEVISLLTKGSYAVFS